MALTLSGYASVFNHAYQVGAFTERIAPGAFTKSLNEGARVHLVSNHGGLPLASTDNGTLRLSQDNVGLKVAAQLDPQDPDSAAIARKVASGLLSEMSFAFQAVRSNWSDDYTQRTVVEASLDKGDVSVVNFGASDATSVNVDGVADPPALSTNAAALTVEQRKARVALNGNRVLILESRGLEVSGLSTAVSIATPGQRSYVPAASQRSRLRLVAAGQPGALAALAVSERTRAAWRRSPAERQALAASQGSLNRSKAALRRAKGHRG